MTMDTGNHAVTHFREVIPRGLVVSCQAHRLDPLYGSLFMQKMAESAALGGAVAIRANGFQDIDAICQTVSLPVIGIVKDVYPSSPVTITPTFREAGEAARAGARVIALDGTRRIRPGADDLGALIHRIHTELGLPVLADVACLDDGRYALDLGADALATTLAGYVDGQTTEAGPDLDLLRTLVQSVRVPVIAEGRYDTPRQAAEAMMIGAWAVVVGSAITRPAKITERFARAMLPHQSE
jgi:N-acylglucosamine-6-phosphate 2-epimerase